MRTCLPSQWRCRAQCSADASPRSLAPRRKNIGECKSKQEEDKILQCEVATLKARFTETLTPKKMKEGCE